MKPLLLVALALLLCQSLTARNLIDHNPFVKPGTKKAPTQTKAPPPQPRNYEFRGILQFGDEWEFSIHDVTKKRSYWIKINDPQAPIKLLSYNPTSKSLVGEVNGQRIHLTLKDAKHRAMAVASNKVAPPATNNQQGQQGQRVIGANTGTANNQTPKANNAPVRRRRVLPPGQRRQRATAQQQQQQTQQQGQQQQQQQRQLPQNIQQILQEAK